MKIREIIALFLPPIVYKLKKLLIPKQTDKPIPLPPRERKTDRMIVIGNGPSLNLTVDKYRDMLQNTECMMVNFSASTTLFEEIKPSVYVLLDPAWFSIPKHLSVSIRKLINDLKIKTKWPMTLVIPRSKVGCQTINEITSNPNITIMSFYDGWWGKDDNRYEAWDNNTIDPPGQTVLSLCVWLSVYWGYKETYLVGADTSIVLDTRVDQADNTLYTIDQHFYNNTEIYQDHGLFDAKHCRKFEGQNMLSVLQAATQMFQDYYEINKYAKWKGVKIYNASEYSLIDCFERRKLS